MSKLNYSCRRYVAHYLGDRDLRACIAVVAITNTSGCLKYAIPSAGRQKNRQVCQWRTCRDLIEHVGDKPAMVARVVDHMLNDFASAHFALFPANKGEAH
jgi:hypothetical protein